MWISRACNGCPSIAQHPSDSGNNPSLWKLVPFSGAGRQISVGVDIPRDDAAALDLFSEIGDAPRRHARTISARPLKALPSVPHVPSRSLGGATQARTWPACALGCSSDQRVVSCGRIAPSDATVQCCGGASQVLPTPLFKIGQRTTRRETTEIRASCPRAPPVIGSTDQSQNSRTSTISLAGTRPR